jgi:hypothetical protein
MRKGCGKNTGALLSLLTCLHLCGVLFLALVSEVKEMESFMHDLLSQLPDIINKVFDILDLLVVRAAILGLAALGAYALFKYHI